MTPDPEIQKLLARVGALLLAWGRVEYEIQPPPPAAKLSAQVAIRKWARAHANISQRHEIHRQRVRQLMLDFGKARQLRNLIAHGMVDAFGATAQFDEPAIKCFNVDGDAVMVEARELDAAIAALSAMLPEVRALNRAAGFVRGSA